MKKLFSLAVILVLAVSMSFALTVGSVQGLPAMNFDLVGPASAQAMFSLASATNTAFSFGGRIEYDLKEGDIVSYGGYGLIQMMNNGTNTASNLEGGVCLKAMLEGVTIISDFTVLSIYSSGVAGASSTTTFGLTGATFGILYEI
ncbi:MAG: hypothetical protein ABIH39_01090 [Candidatus Margulisiibacteriota bacterium]